MSLTPAPVTFRAPALPTAVPGLATAMSERSSVKTALNQAWMAALGTPICDFIQPVEREDVEAFGRAELRAVFDQILLSKRPEVGLLRLYESGLLRVVLPEVTALFGFGEGDSQHKDVWRHSLQVVAQSVPRLAVRWAALLHDVGKPHTKSVASDGTVHFHHHAEVGARMFDRWVKRERLFAHDAQLAREIRFLILHHQRAHQYDEGWTDSAVRRLARELGPALPDLMALSRADMTTKYKTKRQRFLRQLKGLQRRIESLSAEDTRPKLLPKGLGEALIQAFGLPPSKLIGDIRRELEEAVEAGELEGQLPMEDYVQFVRSHSSRFGLPQSSPDPNVPCPSAEMQ